MRAICRVAKVKGAGSIGGKSDHNYRQGHVPNADPERLHLNHEYILNYENLAKAIDARIRHAGIERVRKDAVKGMEFVLAASPEAFKRDQAGQVTDDFRESDWVKANLAFMKQQYGPNLVAFTLHQDEKTPHIHAIVVPITADNRLSAKELFNPKTLRQLQTDYAAAMKPFGLERGIEGSRAQHVDMKHIYGLQQQERQTIEQDLQPVQTINAPLTIDKPGTLDLLNLERWKQQQEAKINAEHNRRLDEIKQAAEKALKAAVANATAKEQEKVLTQRLTTSEGLKQANFEKAKKTGEELATTTSKIDQIAVLLDEKRLNPKWSEGRADHLRSKVLPKMEADILACLKERLTDSNDLNPRLEKKGYKIQRDAKGTFYLTDPKTEVRLNLVTAQIKGEFLSELVEQTVQRGIKEAQQEKQKKAQKPEVKNDQNTGYKFRR
jgi:hypothetical protein